MSTRTWFVNKIAKISLRGDSHALTPHF